MSESKYIIREPLLDPKENVLGYRLSWQQCADDESEPGADPAAIAFLAEHLNDEDGNWLFGDNVLLLDGSLDTLSTEILAGMQAKSTIMVLSHSEFTLPGTMEAVQSLREEGFGIALRDSDFDAQDKSMLALSTHIIVNVDAPDFALQARVYDGFSSSPVRMIATGVKNWEQFDSCAEHVLDVLAGDLFLNSRSGTKTTGLNPAQVMILQLMEMVRKNADVRQLEGILRRDAALSYKLLRYINSVGFGLGAEIQSLRHAVTMLGYSPLYRWLSLLLATASTSGHSPVLMQTAVIRGRFAELLGQDFLPKNESENLFVAGMFSLLDKLLGIPMEQVLEKLQLSEPVEQALLGREGIYGPFLALAEACESKDGAAEALADSLFISAKQVNHAHLSALAWAQNLAL